MSPFGGPVRLQAFRPIELGRSGNASEDMNAVRRALADLGAGGVGLLRIYQPSPTAAFAPSDRASSRYDAAAEAVRSLGFEPVERMAGGRLAVYDENALILDLVAPHSEPRLHVLERFGLFANAIAEALTDLGVDARVGEVPGEYCPGQYSVNGAGRAKLVGIAQRVGRGGYHLGAVISVRPSEIARIAVERAYTLLDLPFNTGTFGAISDFAPTLSWDRLRSALLETLSTRLEIEVDEGADVHDLS